MELLFSCLIIIIMSLILLKNVANDLFAKNEITTSSEQGPKKVKFAKNQKPFVKPFSLLRREKLQFFA